MAEERIKKAKKDGSGKLEEQAADPSNQPLTHEQLEGVAGGEASVKLNHEEAAKFGQS